MVVILPDLDQLATQQPDAFLRLLQRLLQICFLLLQPHGPPGHFGEVIAIALQLPLQL